MKFRSFIATMLLLAVACAAQAEPILLKYKFSPADVDKMQYTYDTSFMMFGKLINFSMGMQTIQKAATVQPNGAANCELTFANMSFSGAGAGSVEQAANLSGKAISFTMSPDGSITGVAGVQNLIHAKKDQSVDASRLADLTFNSAIFPSSPVNVGDSWNASVPIPMTGSSMNFTSTLVAANEQIWGLSAARIKQEFKGAVNLTDVLRSVLNDAKVDEKAKAMLRNIECTVDYSGSNVFLFSPERGKLLKGNGSMKSVTHVTVYNNGEKRTFDVLENSVVNFQRFK